jgi:uncharacterized protein (TIGR02118 family)
VKLILTVGFDRAGDGFPERVIDQTYRLVGITGAARGAVELPISGDEAGVTPEVPPPHPGVSAVISLWEPTSPAAALDALSPGEGRLVAAYLAEEVVQLDYARDWPPGTGSPGIKQLVFLRRRPDLGQQAFLDHWRNNHGPLAVKHHGFWRYVQDHVTKPLTESDPPLDGIAELHFRQPRDMVERMYKSEEGMRLILEDVERFVDLSTLTMLVTKEYLLG